MQRSRLANPAVRLPRPAAPPEPDPNPFDAHLAARGHAPLFRRKIETLQVNIGLRCNLACHHCHVESGPKRREKLDRRGIERILWLLERHPDIGTLDITGGAPELHEDFRDLVRGARSLGRRVTDRCNLTVLFEPGQQDTAEFLAEQGVDIVASLPCYSLENVERQRGRGVFDGSIRALQRLNELGYGRRPDAAASEESEKSGGRLDLVYNPVGDFLPPSQAQLEADYREQLSRHFTIHFDQLLTITNMPIKRFAHELQRDGRYEAYMALLVNHFNPANVPGLMCRHLISVAHDGTIYDCDFNQALELRPPGPRRTIYELDDLSELEGATISTGEHCFGCTAGAGSSCGGSLS